MRFSASDYGEDVAAVLALDGDGHKLMPLLIEACSSEEARRRVPSLNLPDAAKCGLLVYLSCFAEAHELAQSIPSPEGAFWHGILHRREPDPGNAEYWFRRVGDHSIFAALARGASAFEGRSPDVMLNLASSWDPFRFIDICERARRAPASELERVAREIQRAEWQLLFDHCARRGQ